MKSLNSIYKPLIILLAAGLLAGCNKLRPDSTDIRFSVSEAWQLGSKSLANTEDDLQSKSFSVLGKYSTGATYNASATSTVFDNQPVSFDSSNGWDYSPKQNWEKSSTYRFCAYWPATAGVTLSGNMSTDSGVTLSGYKVATDYASQADLLISNIVERTTPSNFAENPAGVELSFHHLLTNIKFAVQKTPGTLSTIVVTNIQLSNVKNSGTYTNTSISDLEDYWKTGAWSDVFGSVTYNSGRVSQEIGSGDYFEISGWGGFVAIPQSIGADEVTVTVEYTSTPQGGTATVRRVDLKLPASTLETSWKINTKITYRLIIDEDNAIKFGMPTVEPWGTAQASGTIIIK